MFILNERIALFFPANLYLRSNHKREWFVFLANNDLSMEKNPGGNRIFGGMEHFHRTSRVTKDDVAFHLGRSGYFWDGGSHQVYLLASDALDYSLNVSTN